MSGPSGDGHPHPARGVGYHMRMALDTTLEAQANIYLANASYDVNGSASECKAFIAACRKLLVLMPKATAKQQSSVNLTPDLVLEAMNQASQWLSVNDDSTGNNGGVKHLSFETFR